MFGLPILFLKITNENISGILTGKFLSFTVTNLADGSILVLAVVHALCNIGCWILVEREISAKPHLNCDFCNRLVVVYTFGQHSSVFLNDSYDLCFL